MAQKISREPLEYSRHPAMVPTQDPDLLDELAYEHRHIEALWAQLQRAHRLDAGSGNAVDAARLGDADQRDLGGRLIEAMARHEAVERKVLYPAAAEAMNAEWAEHARADHEEFRDLLDAVHGQDPAEEQIFELFTEALTRATAHILEEEKVLFPIMRVAMPRGTLTHPGHPSGRELLPGHHDVIDLAGAERQLEAADGNGNGNGKGNGRKGKKRLRLLRR